MRTIKFRLTYQHEETGRILQVKYDLFELLEAHQVDIPIQHKGYGLIAKDQFTGLKDKNGVEIYEGDIVHYKYDYYGLDNWEVKYEYDSFVMIRGETQTGYQNASDDPHYNNWKECEVIGNIHQHKHLLEANEQE